MVMQVIQAAHIGRSHRDQFGCTGIFGKQVVKQAGIVQIFRNGDLQLLFHRRLFAEREHGICNKQQADRKAGHDCNPDVSHTGCKAKRHGEEDAGDIPRRSRRRAEADQAERTRHRNARADIAVDQQDDDLHQRRDQRQCDRHGLGIGIFEHVHTRDQHAEHQRRGKADEKGLRGDARVQDGAEQQLRHRTHRPSGCGFRAAWPDRPPRIWKNASGTRLLRTAHGTAKTAPPAGS